MYKVMIIDDEPWSRKVIKQLGEWDKHGLVIVGEADDGTEGLRLIDELLPDIVVTDMRMPGINGVELLLALNTNHPALKIIVMSGYDDFVYLKQAILSQAKDYLLKPVDPVELNHALAKCVSELKQTNRSLSLTGHNTTPLTDSNILDQFLEQRNLSNRNKLDMAEVQSYINQNYKEGITLESIADFFYISKEHLSRSFKTFSGDTVTDYINRKRMEKAKQLIVEHKLSIKHAAEMTGYTDLAYFYRVFKKHNGFTPGELRKLKD